VKKGGIYRAKNRDNPIGETGLAAVGPPSVPEKIRDNTGKIFH